MEAKIEYIVKRINKNVEKKNRIEENFRKESQELTKQIRKDKMLLDKLNEALSDYICPNCKGSGEKTFTDGAGEKDTVDCTSCDGTGFKI